MPDVVTQTMGDGNQFNIDQVNNLVDTDSNSSHANYYGGAGGSWCEPGASFSMDAKIEGGKSRIDDVGDIGTRASVSSSADAVLNQSAFDQNITQGANIQFNSITIQAAGDDLTDRRYSSSFAFDPRGISRAGLFSVSSFQSLQLPTRS